jgi:Tfp pilus assembly PilM family ATPase
LRDGNFNTARSILGAGVKDLQEQLSASLGISAEQSSDILMGNNVREAGIDESKVKPAVEYIFEEISMKVDTALRYFSSSDNYRKPSKILIAGGGSNITGLASFLADRLSLDEAQLNPFKTVNYDKSRFSGVDWAAAASIYPIALGLALRRF